jgi:hypothetical protein
LASSNVNFDLTGIDPDSVKASLIQFLQSQSQFQDYNYNGPNMSVLIDLLGRNTFMNAFLCNMTFNEMFIDSAQLRDSAVSRAKELNYLPSSMESSFTSVNVAFQTSNINLFQIPKATAFTGVNSNGTYTFTTDQDYIQSSTNGYFFFSNVAIYEGTYVSEIFTIDNSIENQLFTLSNPSVDISSISVLVSEDAGSTNNVFVQTTDLYGLSGNSQVYFVQPASGNSYSVQFGDGVLGYKPQNGAIIILTYRVTFGPKGNEVGAFVLNDNLGLFNNGSVSNTIITPSGNSQGGALQETIGSIKFRAPRYYQTQQNAVVANDYKTLVLKRFPQIADINVYGGGITANAVQFGTVFIAAVSQNGNPLTQATKDAVVAYINTLTVIPFNIQMVDANTLFLDVTTTVHIDFNSTNVSIQTANVLIQNTINQFSSSNLEIFSTNFRYSRLGDAIDNTAPYVISNETTVNMKKFASIIFNTNTSINFSFNNPVVNVTSSPFIINGTSYYVSDVVNNVGNTGNLYLISNTNSSTIGKVNYANGTVFVSSLNISAFSNNSSVLAFVAAPLNKDIYANLNDIIQVDDNSLIVNVANN